MHLPFLLSKPICLTLTAFILLTVDLASYVSFNILSARTDNKHVIGKRVFAPRSHNLICKQTTRLTMCLRSLKLVKRSVS